MAAKKSHIGLNCPHCGRYVKLNPLGRFQRSVPCPQCHVPIDADYIEAVQAEEEETEASEESE